MERASVCRVHNRCVKFEHEDGSVEHKAARKGFDLEPLPPRWKVWSLFERRRLRRERSGA